MIIVRNLSKQLVDGTEILSKISFQADRGELIAVVGGSGSGKTTLLKCVALKDKWTEGQLIYNGTDLTTPKWTDRIKLRKEWAFLDEKPMMNPNLSALKVVLGGRFFYTPLWRKLTGTVSTDEHVLGMDYLEKVGLLDKAHEKASKLSGGESQRVAIARALAQGAKVIVADEPIKGLDPQSADRVMQDFKSLCQRQELVAICSMQNLDLAERFATRIWGLARGRIVLDIPARRLTQYEKNLIFQS
ncbi:phosphonate ABC transporter ATP-binding protein [Paenibacillus koleovorans]|uniref:phosphonate ABC transporter ATP-binding protein n=1 Tax=Paenibacillus koleovorans TaxID=121608 RepID=UPI000FD70525|nr:ATP-binding cassette domain-containing protein [Paenibacillus koleovorans]